MGTVVDRLLADMDVVFCEEDTPTFWHVTLMDSIKDLAAGQAAWTPSAQRNSIWKIVDHVSLWKEDVTRRLASRPPRPEGWAQAADWRDIAEPTEANWRSAVRRLVDAHARLRAGLAERSDEDLSVPPAGDDRPLYTSVQGVIVHDSYHCGQICYLRALQGVPAKAW